jgi:hypothetical protein
MIRLQAGIWRFWPSLAGISSFWAGFGLSRPAVCGQCPGWAGQKNPGWAGAPPGRLGRRHSCSLGWASAKMSRLGWLPQSRLGRYLLRPGLVRALPPGRVKQAAPASSALPPGRAGAGHPGLVQLSPGPRRGRSGRFRLFRIAFLRYESDSIFLLIIRLVWHKKDQLAVSNLAFIILLNS